MTISAYCKLIKHCLFIILITLSSFQSGRCQTTPLLTIQDNEDRVLNSITFTADSTKVAVGDFNSILTVYDIATGEITNRYDSKNEGEYSTIFDTDISDNGYYAVAGGSPYTGKLWDVRTNTLIKTIHNASYYESLQPPEQGGSITEVDISHDNKYFLTYDTRGILEIWDLKTVEPLYEYEFNSLDKIQFLRDNRIVFQDTFNTVINIIDIQTGEIVSSFEGGDFSISYEENVILATVRDLTDKRYYMQVYDINDKAILKRQDIHDYALNQRDISPLGRNVLFGSKINNGMDKNRRLVDVESSNELRAYPVNRNQPENSPQSTDSIIRYLPNGKKFATVNGNKIHIWDIGDVVSKVKDDQLHETGNPNQ